MGNVDGSLADRDLYLLKVPKYVADSWRAAMEGNPSERAGPSGGPAEGPEAALGWIRLGEDGQQHLEIAGGSVEGGEERMPKRYKLIDQKVGDQLQMHIMSQSGAQVKCEGRVVHTLTAQPSMENGRMDAAYTELTGKNDREANKAKGEVRVNKDQVRILSLASARYTTQVSKAAQRKRSLTREEFAMQRKNIEAELFVLFEKVRQWTLGKLMKETGLAPMYLKEILMDIAVLNKRGPYKDMWSIRKEFLANPDEPDDAAAAGAVAGAKA